MKEAGACVQWKTPSADTSHSLIIPAAAAAPVLVIMEPGFISPPGFRSPAPSGEQKKGESGWQQQVLSRVWGYPILSPARI